MLCVIIAYFSAQVYLRYADFEYSARATLLIKDAGNSGTLSEQSLILAEQAGLGEGRAMDNVIQIFRSLTLMEKVVDSLDLDIGYYRIGNIKDGELYKYSPFLLKNFDLKNGLKSPISFVLELEDYQSFLLKLNEEDEEGERFFFGKPFQNAFGTFEIIWNSAEAIIPGLYRLTISPIDFTASLYRSNLEINRIGSQTRSSVLELSIVDPVPQKASDIINELIKVYNAEEVFDENQVFRNTKDFIDKRVGILLSELDSIEGGVQDFKSANAIITDDAASSLSFSLNEVRSAIQQLSEFEVQKDLLVSLESFLVNDKLTFDLIPANLIAESPVLTNLVSQYNDLILRRNSMITTASQINPSRIAIEGQITDIRSLILETIQNLQRDLKIPMDRLENTIRELTQSMNRIPSVEKRLLEKMREQSIKENLFLYLLQKREETALSMAITTAKTRTIDYARVPKSPVYPRKNLVKIASVLIGFLVPLIFLMLQSIFEVKIYSEDTIKNLSSLPILGRIAQSKEKAPVIVKTGSRSAVNEMFRLLRANLSFINPNKDRQTILVTSSISGEGKTFIVVNLGITLTLSHKKVVMLGMDLRRPKLAKYIGSDTEKMGISNYLINQCTLDEVLQVYEPHPDLSYITCGTIPPNPTELLLTPKMEELFSELQERFDFILIDTPPISLVSDALLLRKFISNTLIVVRDNYTKKAMLRNLEEMHQNDELVNANLIYNGIKYNRRYGYSGSYYYGYGKGYYVD